MFNLSTNHAHWGISVMYFLLYFWYWEPWLGLSLYFCSKLSSKASHICGKKGEGMEASGLTPEASGLTPEPLISTSLEIPYETSLAVGTVCLAYLETTLTWVWLVFIEQGHAPPAKQLWKWELPANSGQIKDPLSVQSLHTCELQEWECHRGDNRRLTFGQLRWQNQLFWSPAGCREGFVAGGKCTLDSGRCRCASGDFQLQSEGKHSSPTVLDLVS